MTSRFAIVAIALLTTFLVSACKSPPVTGLTEEYTNWRSYALNSEIFAVTGSSMISIREGHFLPNFVALAEIMPSALRTPPLGVEWVARHSFHGDCGDAQYVITNRDWYKGEIGFVINADGDLPCELAVLEVQPPKLFKNSGRTWSVGASVPRPAFRPLQGLQVPHKRLMKTELIYNGRSGDTIFIIYREFLDDLARPAFFQELRYDLHSSSRLQFRNWEIEVFEASNSGIHFQVVRD